MRLLGRKQVPGLVRVDGAEDHAAADARVESRLPRSLAASSRPPAAPSLQHSRLPRHALRQTVPARRRQGLGRAGSTV